MARPGSPLSELDALLGAAHRRAVRYLETLGDRGVVPDADAVAALRELDVPLQEQPIDPALVLAELDDRIAPTTTGMAGPRFFGFVTGGVLPAALAADWLATAWDQNTAWYKPTPGTAHIEQVALRWILDLLRLPSSVAGAFVTGTTVAHITALSAARHAVLERCGWNVETDGLFGAPAINVIVSAEAHPTLLKALGVVGFGRTRVTRIPTDGQGRMRAGALPKSVDGPTIVCTQVGNVNTGACDPVSDVCDWSHGGGAWVHVDGAFGLWARVAPTRAHFVEGIEKADSWATDAHKWLNVPYDSGIALVRDGNALRAAMAITAEYLPTESAFRNPSDYTLESSRRARGVALWAALRSLGRSGVEALVERNCRQARDFASRLSVAGFPILNDVVLNQVLVSFGDADRTRRIIAMIQNEGTMWAGETVWQGKPAMRISVSSWATTDDDVRRSVDAIVRMASVA